VDLTKQQRLYEPPGGNEGVKVLHGAAQFERSQHIPIDIDITLEIRVSDLTFVDTSDRTQSSVISDSDPKAGRAGPKMLHRLVGQNDVEPKPAKLKNGRQIDQACPRLQFSKCELMRYCKKAVTSRLDGSLDTAIKILQMRQLFEAGFNLYVFPVWTEKILQAQ